MEISFKGSTEEFFAVFGRRAQTVIDPPTLKLFGDLPPPPPPPPPSCSFSEQECTTLKSVAAVIFAAPSGVGLTIEDGTLVTYGPWTQQATSVYNPSTGTYSPGAWPP